MGIGTGTAALIGGVASAGAGIAGSAMQSGAAGSAAQQQAAKAQQAMNIASGNLSSAVNAQAGATMQQQGLMGSALTGQQAATGQEQAFYTPYMNAGYQGVGTLSNMMNTGQGGLLQPWTGQFQAPTAAQAAATPGYQFQLQQGLNAMQNSAAAKGNLLSGGTMKQLNNYAQGVASTNYQQTYNNAFQNYLQNYGQFQTNQANSYNRLMGLTGIGLGATQQQAALTQQGQQAQTGIYGQMGAFAQQGAANLANLYSGNTSAMSQLLGTQGAAQAAGTMGQANAWAGGLNNLGGTAMNLGLLSALGGGQGSALSGTDLWSPSTSEYF